MSDFFLLTRHDNRLFITVRFPITMRAWRFDFYRVEKFPIAIPDNEHTCTLLTDTTFCIAVPTQTRRGYIVFQTADDATFRNGVLDLTVNNLIILSYARKHCIMSLFRGITDVNALCTFSVLHSQSQPSVSPLLHNRVLFNNVDSLDLICPTANRYNITGCRLCVYTLHCGCALRTPYAIVPAMFSTCTPHVDNTTILHSLSFYSSFSHLKNWVVWSVRRLPILKLKLTCLLSKLSYISINKGI